MLTVALENNASSGIVCFGRYLSTSARAQGSRVQANTSQACINIRDSTLVFIFFFCSQPAARSSRAGFSCTDPLAAEARGISLSMRKGRSPPRPLSPLGDVEACIKRSKYQGTSHTLIRCLQTGPRLPPP